MVIENDSAHEKWCPEGRMRNYDSSINRDTSGGIKGMPTCMGSRCAAWRWWDEGGPCEIPLSRVNLLTQQGWVCADNQALAREGISIVMVNTSPSRKGYCGKAERPTWP